MDFIYLRTNAWVRITTEIQYIKPIHVTVLCRNQEKNKQTKPDVDVHKNAEPINPFGVCPHSRDISNILAKTQVQ